MILYIKLVQESLVLFLAGQVTRIGHNDLLPYKFFFSPCERACFSMLFRVLIAALLLNNPPIFDTRMNITI